MNNSSCNNSCTSNNTECSYIAEILKVIVVLQANACPETCLNSCDRPVLGGGSNCIVCNTRPIMLYTCCGNGTPWSMPTSRSNINCNVDATSCSSVFRVEKVDGCTATFRVLAPNTDTTSTFPYESTDSVFTMDLSCLCTIRCLNDTFVDCVCC